MPKSQNSALATGLLVDLSHKIAMRATQAGKSESALLGDANIDRRNLQKLIRKAQSGQSDVYLGTVAEIVESLDIVLEFQGFILGPAIRPKP